MSRLDGQAMTLYWAMESCSALWAGAYPRLCLSLHTSAFLHLTDALGKRRRRWRRGINSENRRSEPCFFFGPSILRPFWSSTIYTHIITLVPCTVLTPFRVRFGFHVWSLLRCLSNGWTPFARLDADAASPSFALVLFTAKLIQTSKSNTDFVAGIIQKGGNGGSNRSSNS